MKRGSMKHLRRVFPQSVATPLLCVGLVLSFLTGGSPGLAATSITPTPDAGGIATTVTPNGNIYGITGGKTVGSNLFHSFDQFSVATGDIARFQTSNLTQNAEVSTILGRVTGGNPSAIFGTIDSATYYPSAHLFLMNPHGFIFGPNATLNIGGLVHFTTAEYLKLTDGNVFKAAPDVTADTLLTTFPVAAFGFLGTNPATIALQNSQLTVANGTGLSLIGGDRGFNSTDPDTERPTSVPNGMTMTGGRLSAPGGQINLVSIGSPGEIAVDTLTPRPNSDGVSPNSFGNINLLQNAQLNATGTAGGTIRIRGGQLLMDSAFMIADSTVGTANPTTAIAVNITGNVTLANQSGIQARALGPDKGGNIDITATNMSILDGSKVATEGKDAGQAGDIGITATEKVSISGVDAFNRPGRIESFTLGSGASGSIRVTATHVALTDAGLINTLSSGEKRAGNITLTVDRLDISGGGAVITSGGELAPSGSIYVAATDTISLSGIGEPTGLSSRIANENASGDTGTIHIETNNLQMTHQGRINSSTALATAEPIDPKIDILVHNAMTLSGESQIDVGAIETDVGTLAIQAGSLALSGLSVINTETSGPGASGPINIATGALTVTGGSQIISASSQGLGNGGDISVVTTGDVTLAGNATDSSGEIRASSIISQTHAFSEDPSFTGNAGNITLTANGHNITISDSARIDSSSTGYALGRAGDISVNARTLSVHGGILSSLTEFAGDAGRMTLEADSLSVTNGGQIRSSASTRTVSFFEGETIPTPTGRAGHISIGGTAGPALSVTISGSNSGVFTSTEGSGAGGNITITAGMTQLTNHATISSKTSGAGDAGNILIKANDVSVTNGATITAESTGLGNAGTVTIQGLHSPANSFLLDGVGSSILTSTKKTGAGGNILVDAKDVWIRNGGKVSADTSGSATSATGGTITIQGDRVRIESGALVTSATTRAARGGSIAVTATESVSIKDGAVISASSTGSGDAGSITINAGQRFDMRNGSVTTSAKQATGGNIEINATDLIRVVNGQISTSVLGGTGNGGNISIDPNTVILQNSQIVAKAVGGAGGNISITTPLFLADQSSLVDASSQFGLHGSVTIQSPTSNLSGTVGQLASKPTPIHALSQTRCAVMADGQQSTFIVNGRQTLPTTPGGWMNSPFTSFGTETLGLTEVPMPTVNLGSAGMLSLRSLPPPEFLVRSFPNNKLTGCRL